MAQTGKRHKFLRQNEKTVIGKRRLGNRESGPSRGGRIRGLGVEGGGLGDVGMLYGCATGFLHHSLV